MNATSRHDNNHANYRVISFMMPLTFKRTTLACLLGAALLAGCGKDAQEKRAGQVLAKVGESELTVHQLNFALGSQPELAQLPRKQVLEQLIDQQVLINKAIDDKLDRDPQVVQAIDAAKRKILAQAAVQRMGIKPVAPPTAEVTRFYEQNPAMFADRKIYRLHVFQVPAKDLTAGLRAALDKAKTPDDVRAVLRGARIAFADGETRTPADQVPVQLAPQLAKLQSGDILMTTQGGVTLLQMQLDATPAPVSLSDATPAIQRYLEARNAQQAFAGKVKQLREHTTVEYLSALEEPALGATPGAAPAVEVSAPATPAAPATKAAEPDKDSTLQKGVGGL